MLILCMLLRIFYPTLYFGEKVKRERENGKSFQPFSVIWGEKEKNFYLFIFYNWKMFRINLLKVQNCVASIWLKIVDDQVNVIKVKVWNQCKFYLELLYLLLVVFWLLVGYSTKPTVICIYKMFLSDDFYKLFNLIKIFTTTTLH